MDRDDTFPAGAVYQLKSQLLAKQKGLGSTCDYIAPTFSARKQTINVPSRNDLQINLGSPSQGVSKQPTGAQNFQF